MPTKQELKTMSEASVLEVNASGLVDIRTISIDTSLPIETRMDNYLNSISNPYLFLSGDVKVKISFLDTGKTLESAITRYFSDLKNA